MKGRIVWLSLFVGCASMVLTGCESLQPFTRKASPEKPAVPVDDGESESSSTTASAGPKGFFKNSRLPGAMSSEGAEIERSLGVQ
ncbi:MAG TPA: hypothetical protein VGZ22_31280 [Isosphaeraceae bacterium]|nr:hypothetical protein [Isosphaeraceae bacterium]